MTPQEVMQLIYILYGIISVETLMLIFIIWKTPAMTFLKASLLKSPIMYVIGKDHMGIFRTFKPQNGAGYIKKVGLFHLTESSHTLEAGSKIPIYFAFRDLAATLLPEYPAIIQEIRENGFHVTTLDDVTGYLTKIKKGMMESVPIKIKPYKTYKFHDLANLFPYNLDPTFIDSTVQCEVSKFTKIMKVGPMAMMGLVTLLIVAAISVFIIQRAFKGQVGAADCAKMVSAAKCSVSAVQTIINTTALI